MPPPVSSVISRIARRLAGLALLAAPLLAGADDNYLREIEEEAKHQATILTTSQPLPSPFQEPPAPPAPPVAGASTDAAPERLASGLDRAAFEKALRDRLPKERYASFQRLGNADQQQVYQHYHKDSGIASISEQIARLASGKP